MKSNIIRLGDYTMDAQDRVLRELFASRPPADDGFKNRVMQRITARERARARLRRWLLPAALLAGCAVAAPSLNKALAGLSTLLGLGTDSLQAAGSALPDAGGMPGVLVLLCAAVMVFRLLED